MTGDHPNVSPASDRAAGNDRAGHAVDGDAGTPTAVPAPDTQDPAVRELAEVPAVEVITRACVMLMSAAAEKLGLAEDGDRYLDLDEARRLIDAYAGLLGAAQSDLGVHRQPLREGLKALQSAFREASPYPDEPGSGPGERASR